MKASDLFVGCLEAEGVEYIFGVPGEENADFMMSLEQSDAIQFILTRFHIFERVLELFPFQACDYAVYHISFTAWFLCNFHTLAPSCFTYG